MSIDGFRQGDAPAAVYFNIIAASIYRKQLAMLNLRGVLFAIADDVKIAAPPAVIAEINEAFTELVWQEAGRTTQVVKNTIFVQPFARAGRTRFLESTPRDPSASLPIQGIPDGGQLLDPLDPNSSRVWPMDKGINVLGTPLGSPDFIES